MTGNGTEKAKGGRGKKTTNPYQRLSVTIPPRLGEWLEGEATRQGVTRSEVVAQALSQAKRLTITMATKPTPNGPILKQRGKGKWR